MQGEVTRLEGRILHLVDACRVAFPLNLKLLVTNLLGGESRKVRSVLGSRDGLSGSRDGLTEQRRIN